MPKLSVYGCVDACFSKYHFIENVSVKTNICLVSRLRDDAYLRYLFRREPKQPDGKVDIKNTDLNYFKLAHSCKVLQGYTKINYY
ncbi:hypothetical protein V9L05_19615 [Bernardetia sp. Wsw4-3y2]|uniref:hypothetical protein n=1 Tax=unclassified Bernardetia TaxID=2647129 RepID=UPI0030D23047